MIPHTETQRFESNVTAITHRATIALTSEMIKLLSAHTYSDRILATVREPLSNAYDSQVRAGTLHIPAEVHLPTPLEPWFSVRDYGTGLSQEDVFKYFLGYGESDKRNTNDEIGGKGIGAKAFYAYTDQATITSWFHGTKRVFNLAKDASGIPQGILIHHEPTIEPDGLEVQIPARNFHEFEDKAKQVLRYLELPYNCNIPLNIEKPTILYSDIIAGYRLELTGDNESKILMGGIAYRIPFHVYANGVYLNDMGIHLHMPIGAVEIAASRETLSPSEADQNRITKLVADFYNVIVNTPKWNEEIQNQPNWIAAAKLRKRLRSLFHRFSMFDDTLWNNHSLNDTSDFDIRIICHGRRKNSYVLEQCSAYTLLDGNIKTAYWGPKIVNWKPHIQRIGLSHIDRIVYLLCDTEQQAINTLKEIGLDLIPIDAATIHTKITRTSSSNRNTDETRRGKVVHYKRHDKEIVDASSLPDESLWINNSHRSLDKLKDFGLLLKTPVYIQPYGLTAQTAEKRFGHLPTTGADWLKQHPDALDQQKGIQAVADALTHTEFLRWNKVDILNIDIAIEKLEYPVGRNIQSGAVLPEVFHPYFDLDAAQKLAEQQIAALEKWYEKFRNLDEIPRKLLIANSGWCLDVQAILNYILEKQ